MEPTILISGLPGKMASLIAEGSLKAGLKLAPLALGAPENEGAQIRVLDQTIAIVSIQNPAELVNLLVHRELRPVVVDYSVPSAITENVEFYCKHELPFVMGTSGGNYSVIAQQVAAAGNNAVLSANMAPPLVVLRAMFEFAAKQFPGSLAGFNLNVIESHQASKQDCSATAKAMLPLFETLGAEVDNSNFSSIRDPQTQRVLGIPESALAGHAWHTYQLEAADKGVRLEFTHNVNGRDVYVDGTLRACRFLDSQRELGVTSRIFSMADVLAACTTSTLLYSKSKN